MNAAPADISFSERLDSALSRLTNLLLDQLNPAGYWTGELSSSALSTAVATVALRQMDLRAATNSNTDHVDNGLKWLAHHANLDGGWGDTIRSKSNISTTALCWAAFGACDADEKYGTTVASAENWLRKSAGSLDRLPATIAERYGKDRTFSVPILMTLAISGRLDQAAWREIPALPFELAILPRRFYGAVRLPVVSYALPALIAIGQAIHHHAPARNPLSRFLRDRSRARTLNLLSELQPSNGGFLEATPLTAFVTMSLACAGNHSHPVAQKAAAFLRGSMREDGSWPIDSNLATWVTTLSIKALSHQGDAIPSACIEPLRSWLLCQQTQILHPYTGAAPGAWAWTDLPGGVPDADDTAGALIALRDLGEPTAPTLRAAEAGVEWLLNLANRDGGIPTFCPGWGTLAFDRSTPEITAHSLRAWTRWRSAVALNLQSRIDRAMAKAFRYLEKSQNPDGSFIPLWFGNESVEEEANPVYGTAKVLIALNELAENSVPIPGLLRLRAAAFLAESQKTPGGWGGDRNAPESIEETALALEALSEFPKHSPHIDRGLDWLLDQLDSEKWKQPAPIGLYFARLWYFECLYPLIFSVSTLGKLRQRRSKHR